ncbi:hypothetical protein NC651_003698 [Populus alba x Populus x berolinensis]|nr:hypothetical protein NC651_003698 [Populus alba x Populus x berolinensis]
MYADSCVQIDNRVLDPKLSRGVVHDTGRPLPKFGEWDVNDPASAEGFTVIFNKARDEKKTGGKPESPGKVDDSHVKPGVNPAKPQPKTRLNMQQNRERKTDVAYQVDIGLDFVEFHVPIILRISFCIRIQRISFLGVTEVRMIEASYKIYGLLNLGEKLMGVMFIILSNADNLLIFRKNGSAVSKVLLRTLDGAIPTSELQEKCMFIYLWPHNVFTKEERSCRVLTGTPGICFLCCKTELWWGGKSKYTIIVSIMHRHSFYNLATWEGGALKILKQSCRCYNNNNKKN